MIEIFLALIVGVLIGWYFNRPNPTQTEEKLIEDNKKLTEDVAYYRRLCTTIAEENMEFRRRNENLDK
jgi:hypothetical protein